MAEHGEWNREGATLSDVTARKEYGESPDFILQGIRAGKLQYREESVWGNACLRVLPRQLEQYIVEQLGSDYLVAKTGATELRKISKEIADLKKKLIVLQARKSEIEAVVGEKRTEASAAANPAAE
jgi:hypothetical protein